MSDDVVPKRQAADGGRWLRGIVQSAGRQSTSVGLALALAAGYAALLLWFNRVDFYRLDFFVHGPAVVGYQIARLIFIPYFAWTIYFAGALANFVVLGRTTTATLPFSERFPLFFVTGAGLWLVVLFAIGLAGFDTKPVALALSLATMIFSVSHLAECVRASARAVSRMWTGHVPRPSLRLLLWLAIIVAGAIFVFTKGLYPGGGHDYYNHYFQFYKRVLETGSIRPNDVWIHFYYSKGAGLYFLAMLLTDPLAPQLVAAGFIGCGACIVFALLRNATGSALLPLTGVLLYIGAFIYTPGPQAGRLSGGWGILEKLHELTAVLLLAAVWISYRLFRNGMTMPGPWTLALHAAIVSIALLTLPLTLLVGLYLAGYLLWFALKRQWRLALRPFAAGMTAACALMAMAAINYLYTGFPSDVGLVEFWPHADLAKVTSWGTMLEVTMLHRLLTQLTTSQLPFSWQLVPLVASYLRLELWWPIILSALPFALLQLRNRRALADMRKRVDAPAWSALAWFAIVVILIALFGGGRSQPISFYRLSTFSYAPTLCFALLLCHISLVEERGTNLLGSRLPNVAAPSLFAAALCIMAILNLPTLAGAGENLAAIVGNAARLGSGQFSLLDAYRNKHGWADSPFDWGAIHPGMLQAWRIAGPGTRIWSFHIHTYCMLPDCKIQEAYSQRFSPSWQTILFGPPEDGIGALKAEGLNYFFFAADLPMGRDPLPISPIFSPEHIAEHLAVRWTDGTSYLLTWPSDKTSPIDHEFLVAYQDAVKDDPAASSLRARRLKEISDYLALHKQDLHPFCLPWSANCKGLPSID